MARIYPSANKMRNPVTEIKGKPLRPTDVRKMNTAQLTLLARKYNVDIEGQKNNSQRASLIIEAMENQNSPPESLA